MNTDSGVNPLGETPRMNSLPRSLESSYTSHAWSSKISLSGEAEASSAGEQLAEEYPAGNSSRRCGGGSRVWSLTGSRSRHRTIDFRMPEKTHLGSIRASF